jgi:hypothetical protein
MPVKYTNSGEDLDRDDLVMTPYSPVYEYHRFRGTFCDRLQDKSSMCSVVIRKATHSLKEKMLAINCGNFHGVLAWRQSAAGYQLAHLHKA